MKNKYIYLLLIIGIFILISSSANAEYTIIHDDWHKYNDLFTVDGKIIQLSLNLNYPDNMVFKIDNSNYLVERGRCKTLDSNKYCYTNRSIDEPETTISDSGQVAPAVHIVVKQDTIAESTLSITHNYNQTIRGLKESEFALDLKNMGSEWINNIDYVLNDSYDLNVTDPGDFIIIGNQIKKTLSLKPGEEKIFKFKYIPKYYGTLNLSYDLKYDGINTIKSKTGKMTLDVVYPYTIQSSFSNSAPQLGDVIQMNIIITNNDILDITLNSIKITGPPLNKYSAIAPLAITYPGVLEGNINSISPGESKTLTIPIEVRQKGTNNISLEAKIHNSEESYQTNTSYTFKIVNSEPKINFYLDKSEVIPGTQIKLTYELDNSEQKVDFKNVVINFISPIFNKTATLDFIKAGEKVKVLTYYFEAPYTENDMNYNILAQADYDTEYGELMETNTTQRLQVSNSNALVYITQTVNASSAKPGDVLIVESSVKNSKDVPFNLSVKAIFPEEGIFISGETQKNIYLESNSEKKAYIYKLKIPENYKNKYFKITTTAFDSASGNSVNATKSISVDVKNPVVLPNNTTVEVNKSTKTTSNETLNTPPKKEKGFFSKLLDSIDSFFEGLFK